MAEIHLPRARETYKDVFTEDLKGDYNVEPKELISYKMNHTGVKTARTGLCLYHQICDGRLDQKSR